MNFLPDRRGVSEVLGAILVFALVIAVLVIVQVAGVPAANQQIEFEHNTRVQADFQEFDQNVDRAAALGAESSSAVETGVRYPPRLFLINPGPAAGTLATSNPSSISFGNVSALNAETDGYFQTAGALNFESTTLSYRPSYNEYDSAPSTTYEHGILYNSDENGGTAVFDNGNLISGNRISLTTLNGSLSESSTKAVTLDAVPISGPAQTVSITNTASGSPITLTLGTTLSQADWSKLLADEMAPVGNVQSVVVDETADTVTITLKEGVTYDLRLSKVGVGTGHTEEGPAYLTKVGASSPAIQPGGTDITVELRDRFNNPVAGETVSFEITTGNATFVGTTPATTDDDGRTTITVNPIDNTSIDIRAWYDPDGDNNLDTSEDTDPFVVEYNALPVSDNAIPPTGDLKDINPTANIRFVDADAKSKTEIEATFRNDDSTEWTITQMRMSFVLNPDKNSDPTEVDVVRKDSGATVASNLKLGDQLTPVSNGGFGKVGSGDEEVTLEFTFDDDLYSAGNSFEGMLIVTFEAKSAAGEVTYLTYFVAQ